VHPVRAEVGGEVVLQGRDGEIEQPVHVERGEREGGDEERVELERAVVALGREVRADVLDLLAEAREQACLVVGGGRQPLRWTS